LFIFSFFIGTIFPVSRGATTTTIDSDSLSVFWDLQCTDEVDSINWGTLSPGSLKKENIFVRNEGDTYLSFIIETTDWSPVSTSEFISLNYNEDNTVVGPDKVLRVPLQLSVSSDIKSVTYFAFKIIISTIPTNDNPIIEWIRVSGPDGRLDPEGTINPGENVRIGCRVGDFETATQELDVDIYYRHQNGLWTLITEPSYNEAFNYWYYVWTIPVDAKRGLYDVGIEVEDEDGKISIRTETGEFYINSINTTPTVEWIKIWRFGIGRIDPGGYIEIGDVNRIYTKVKCLGVDSSNLNVIIKLKEKTGDWVLVPMTATYNEANDYWYVDWRIQNNEVGIYDVKVEVKAPDNSYFSLVDREKYKVVYTNTQSSVDWIKVWAFGKGRIDPEGSVNQGDTIRLYSQISDLNANPQDLDVSISIRNQAGSWIDFTPLYHAANQYWYYDWTISETTEPGLYIVLVEALYGNSKYTHKIEYSEFRVK